MSATSWNRPPGIAPANARPYLGGVAITLEDLGRAVKQLQYRHHRGMDRRLRDAGTSLAQWDALRAIRHRLTPRGEATLRKGHEVVGPVLESSLAPLTVRQREDFYRLLSRALVEGNPPQRVGL